MLMWQPSRETGRTPCASRAMWCAAAAGAAEAAAACACCTVRLQKLAYSPVLHLACESRDYPVAPALDFQALSKPCPNTARCTGDQCWPCPLWLSHHVSGAVCGKMPRRHSGQCACMHVLCCHQTFHIRTHAGRKPASYTQLMVCSHWLRNALQDVHLCLQRPAEPPRGQVGRVS